jgi:hypothetical protein
MSNSLPAREQPVNKRTALAQRRAELVELCALQRGFLAQECEGLRAPFGVGTIRNYLGLNKKVALVIGSAALGLAVVRPKRLLAMAAAGLSMMKVARSVLPMLSPPSQET